jgi:hypothetical protein
MGGKTAYVKTNCFSVEFEGHFFPEEASSECFV